MLTNEDKLKLFEKELNYIKNPNIKEFTTQILLRLPDYFFHIGASSTGKYHSQVCLGEGGCVRHTQMNVMFAIDLMNLEMLKYTDIQKDIVISTLILHDGLKHGFEEENGNYSKYTVVDHPLLIIKFINQQKDLISILDKTILNEILLCLGTHMGEWNTDYKTKKEILPKPNSKLQNFVHLCDYLGSRKYIKDFDFDVKITRK
jgi:hypothetical protein